MRGFVLAAVTLFSVSASLAAIPGQEPVFAFLCDQTRDITTVRATLSDTVVAEISLGGCLPSAQSLGGPEGDVAYVPIRVWGLFRDALLESNAPGSSQVLSALKNLLGPYADTPVEAMAGNITSPIKIIHRGTDWDAEGHCIHPCNLPNCACKETIEPKTAGFGEPQFLMLRP